MSCIDSNRVSHEQNYALLSGPNFSVGQDPILTSTVHLTMHTIARLPYSTQGNFSRCQVMNRLIPLRKETNTNNT